MLQAWTVAHKSHSHVAAQQWKYAIINCYQRPLLRLTPCLFPTAKGAAAGKQIIDTRQQANCIQASSALVQLHRLYSCVIARDFLKSSWGSASSQVTGTCGNSITFATSGIAVPANLHLTPKLEQKLQKISERCSQLEQAMLAVAQSQDTTDDQDLDHIKNLNHAESIQDMQKEYGSLCGIASTWNRLCTIRQELRDLEDLTHDSDKELAEEAKKEVATLSQEARSLEEQLLISMLPNLASDQHHSAILEVRAGAGGAEASLFARELLDMYMGFALHKGWQYEVLESSASEAGGVRTASIAVHGHGAYQQLRWEAGVHRVQRVPATETQGRLHTSTTSVVVLREADEVEVSIPDSELVIDTYKASGPGGQHVNTTSSAVRITHVPTGIVVSCQDERSQLRNKSKALRMLRARVLELRMREAEATTAAERKAQAGTAERNERIRTYNFGQDRVTDHRAGMTLQGVAAIVSGSNAGALEDIHAALQLEEQTKGLEELVTSEP